MSMHEGQVNKMINQNNENKIAGATVMQNTECKMKRNCN